MARRFGGSVVIVVDGIHDLHNSYNELELRMVEFQCSAKSLIATLTCESPL